MKKLTLVAALAAASLLGGCCLVPNSVRPEVEHISHVSQHFGADKTNFGSETVGVIARWNMGDAYLDVGESYNFSPDHTQCPGGLCGPREVFSARIGYTIEVRK